DTVGPVAARTSSGSRSRKPAARGGSTARRRPPSRKTTSSRRPAASRSRSRTRRSQPQPGPVTTALRGVIPAMAGGGGVVARGAGGVARALGRQAATPRELDQAHRRDGAGLAMLGAGIVLAVGLWWHGAGPAGRWLAEVLRAGLGRVAL